MVWLSVRIQLMNQNVYPAHREDVLAALPIRATRVLMDGNHTAFFNPKPEDAMRAFSHKVWAAAAHLWAAAAHLLTVSNIRD